MPQNSSSQPNRAGEIVTSIESKSGRDREELLRQVIETTFSSASQNLNDQEWVALREVAKSHPAKSQLELGTLCMLVQALIATRFSALQQDEALLQHMSLRIAGTLWSHPIGNQRVRQFWELLVGQES